MWRLCYRLQACDSPSTRATKHSFVFGETLVGLGLLVDISIKLG